MNILNGKRNIKKDLEKVGKFSEIVEKKITSLEPTLESKIDSLNPEELHDLDQILQIADYMLCKYENQQEMYSLLKDFVKMIQHSANSSDILKDKIDEMSFSAENSVQNMKSIQKNVTETDPFMMVKNSSNNLTNTSTPAHINEYPQKSRMETR